MLDSYRQNKKYHRLRTGSFIQLDDNALAGLAEMADGSPWTDAELRTGRIRVPKYRAMYLDKGAPGAGDHPLPAGLRALRALSKT